MKKILLFFFMLIAYSISATAQVSVDTIAIKNSKLYLGEKKLTFKELDNTLKSNDKAYAEFRTVKSNRVYTGILYGSGLGLLCGELTNSIINQKTNWTVLGIGAGLIGISIPIVSNSVKHAKKAIKIYNEDKLIQPVKDNNEMKISMSGNGIGILYRF